MKKFYLIYVSIRNFMLILIFYHFLFIHLFFTGSNAFKHTWAGSVTVRLYSESEDDKEFVVLEVADTGDLIWV
jgi:hypothetical protein